MESRGRGAGKGKGHPSKKTRPLPTYITGTQPRVPDVDEATGGSASSPNISPSPPVPGAKIDVHVINNTFVRWTDKAQSPPIFFGNLVRSRVQNSFWPTYSKVDKDEKDIWWNEFEQRYTWVNCDDATAFKAFVAMCGNRYKDIISKFKQEWIKKPIERPIIFPEEIWSQWLAHWGSEKSVEASERAKMNRASASGSGTKHTTGSISINEHFERMVDEYGNHVTPADVFVSTHTTATSGGEREWIDKKAESTFSAYLGVKEAQVEAGLVEPNETGQVEWDPVAWLAVANDGQKKKGQRVYGLGEYGGATINASKSGVSPSTGRSYFRSRDDSEEVLALRAQLARTEEVLAKQQQDMAERDAAMAERDASMAEMNAKLNALLEMQMRHQSPPS